MKKFALAALLLLTPAVAQQAAPAPAAPAPTAPATNLDAFLARTGILTVRESLGEQSVPALYGASVSLEAVRLYTPGQEDKALRGIALRVNTGERYASTRTEFIDFDEVNDIIKALEYMAAQAPKVNAAVQPQFTFTSKGGAKVGMFVDSSNKLSAYAEAGTANAFMAQSSLEVLRQGLVNLQAKLR